MALPTSIARVRARSSLISILPILADLNELRWLWKCARRWRTDGWLCAPAPFFVRRAMILAEARRIGAGVFIETGTLYGDTPWHFRRTFKRIFTIEVEPNLAQIARERFRKWPGIQVVEGDSATELAGICQQIDEPCVVYLDGHYSHGITGMGNEECPVLAEVLTLFNHLKHPFGIVIDDARLFGTDPAYPTVESLERFLMGHEWHCSLRIENDAIIIRPTFSGQ
jgi:hypothetical protein